MKWRRDQWAQYLVVLALTVGVLICGQLFWHKYAVTGPLDKELLQIKGVESAQWQDSNKGDDDLKLNVALGPVVNLQQTYGEINAAVKRKIGQRAVLISLRDHRGPELEDLYYQINFNIQEAISTGRFVAMADTIRDRAKADRVSAKVYVDAKNVYIQLAKGTDYLYTVVPRQPGIQEVD
jgi:hypothetical protein